MGALVVRVLPSDFLARLVPLLLVAFALYFLFSPRIGDEDRQHRIGHPAFALLIGATVGFYDGFFGPGTGSFFTLAFVTLLGYGLRRAVAGAKLLNFTSNFAALLIFIVGGHVLWKVGFAMGLGPARGQLPRIPRGGAPRHPADQATAGDGFGGHIDQAAARCRGS